MDWTPEVKRALDQVMNSPVTIDTMRHAVFDADGTLWHDDVGEAFFKNQIQNKTAPGIRDVSDPWNEYKKMITSDPVRAYGWLAQINAGLTDQALRDEAADFYRDHLQINLKKYLRLSLKIFLKRRSKFGFVAQVLSGRCCRLWMK